MGPLCPKGPHHWALCAASHCHESKSSTTWASSTLESCTESQNLPSLRIRGVKMSKIFWRENVRDFKPKFWNSASSMRAQNSFGEHRHRLFWTSVCPPIGPPIYNIKLIFGFQSSNGHFHLRSKMTQFLSVCIKNDKIKRELIKTFYNN